MSVYLIGQGRGHPDQQAYATACPVRALGERKVTYYSEFSLMSYTQNLIKL